MRRHLLLVPSCVFALLLIPGAAQATSGWSPPLMVYDGNYREPSLVVDRHGASHLAVTGDTGIWHLANKSGSWVRTRLTTNVGDLVDSHPSIALDRTDGSLVVVYEEEATAGAPNCIQLMYVTNRTGSWSSPRHAGSQLNCGLVSPSAATRDGKIWIAADIAGFACGECGPPLGFQFLTNVSGHWTSTTVAATRNAPTGQSSLVLDDQGRPRVIFRRWTSVWYARGTTRAGNFLLRRVGYGSQPAIALDSHDHARLVYSKGKATYYATHTASGWQETNILDFSGLSSIGIDGNGKARIAVLDLAGENAQGSVWYISNRKGPWLGVRLSVRPDAHPIALGVAPNNRTSVAYENVNDGRVYFRRSQN